MTAYLQLIGGVLMGLILWVMVSRYSKDGALLLSVAVCVMALIAAASYIKPILELIRRLRDLSGMDGSLFSPVIKSVGIGLISEITAMICGDAGNSAMAKVVQIIAAAVILWLSIPLMDALLGLIGELVGRV